MDTLFFFLIFTSIFFGILVLDDIFDTEEWGGLKSIRSAIFSLLMAILIVFFFN